MKQKRFIYVLYKAAETHCPVEKTPDPEPCRNPTL